MKQLRNVCVTIGTAETAAVRVARRLDGAEDLCRVKIGDKVVDRQVQIVSVDDGIATVSVDGRRYRISVGSLNADVIDVVIEARQDDAHIAVEGRVRCSGALRLSSVALPSVPPSDPCIASPITGEVLQVNVVVGESVQTGQALMVIEAMKMEIVIRATASGTIQSVHVAAGDRIQKAAPLVVVAPLEEAYA